MKYICSKIVVVASMALAFNASALLVTGPDIIAAPASVADDAPGAENNHQQGFNERQNVTLLAALGVNGGTIAAGTKVDSHMIFLNTRGNTRAVDTQTWTFSGIILGVMSNTSGSLEAASNAILGAIGTYYPGGFSNRGLEQNTSNFSNSDAYLVSGNSLKLKMTVTEPGDWIRVVTASVPDAGATVGLFGLGVLALGFVARRKK